MDSIKDAVSSVRRLHKRQVAFQIVNFAAILATALMIWKFMSVYTNSSSPIVVVLSESMSPAFERGDLLLLTLDHKRPFSVGDICVFNIPGRDIPIVHRIIKLHRMSNETFAMNYLSKSGKSALRKSETVQYDYMLTKGDHNQPDDRGLYDRRSGQVWISEHDIVGRVRGYLPFVGLVTIIMNDYPQLKFLVLGLLGLFVLFSRE